MTTELPDEPRAPARPRAAVEATRIDEIFASFDKCHSPGVVIGIALEGRPVYRKGFGLANVEQPLTLTPATRMRIASITKHFTCLAYLLLCEEGRASPEDTIGMHVPDLAPTVCDARIDDLMTHTSGLRDAEEIHHQMNGTAAAATIEDILAFYRSVPDRSAPVGVTWRYNNGAYLLLGRAIEHIAGQPLSQVFAERIFGRVGMNDTFLRPSNSDFVANSAAMHMTAADGRFIKDYINHEQGGEGGIVSTIDDMLRWMVHMDAPVVGTAGTWHAMFEPRTLRNGVSTAYGCGLMIGNYRGVRTLAHSGGLMGAKAHMLKAPDAGLDIVILSNRHDVSATLLAHQVIDACVPSLGAREIESARVPAEGVYRSQTSGRVIALRAARGRQIVSLDGLDFAMALVGENELCHFPVVAYLAHRILLHGDPSHPRSLELHDFGQPDTFELVKPTAGRGFAEVAGTYECEAARATIEIDSSGIAVSRGACASARFVLEWLAPDVARGRAQANMPWGGIFAFTREGLLFSTFTTPRLAFRRTHAPSCAPCQADR
jgi:D-aminopeptidase